MRLTIALNAIISATCALLTPNTPTLMVWILGLLSIAAALALLLGFVTPFAGLSAAAGYATIGASSLSKAVEIAHIHPATAFNLAAISIILVVLGPGAYSLDARLFGRREIIIPDSRRPPAR